MKMKRRGFLSTLGASVGLAGGAALTASAENEAVLRGQIFDYEGNPISRRRVTIGSKDSGHYDVTTDGKGNFEQSVSSNATYRLGLYRYKYGPQPDEPNGVPHVCSLGRYSIGTGETDLGELRIPKAHLVEVRALDSEGDPVGGINARLYAKGEAGDYWGTGPSTLETNHEGYIVVDDGPYTGIELIKSVDLSISIPNGDGGAIQYSRELYVEEPLRITAQVGEGMTIEEAGDGADPHESTTEEPTTTEETETPTTTEETQTAETTDAETTESTTESTDQPETTTTEKQATAENSNNSSDASESRPTRGFFSNENPDTEYEFLSDPFFLTFGGFALSILGVLHNMVR